MFASAPYGYKQHVLRPSGDADIRQFQDIVDSDVGTLTVTDGEFTLVIEGRPVTGTMSRRNDTLMMHIITGVEWDFGDDGLDEPTTLLLEMQRSR